MKAKFLLSILFAIFELQNAYGATEPCIDGSVRVAASTKAIFTCDTSTTLINAWRDPSGLIWSTLRRNQNDQYIVTRLQGANDSCQLRNFRLPTAAEFTQLAAYLGQGTPAGYSRFDVDGNLVLPLLDYFKDYPIWTSTRNSSYSNLYLAFKGDMGGFDSLPAYWETVYICVTRK